MRHAHFPMLHPIFGLLLTLRFVIANDVADVRSKRQTMMYLCGMPPNQFISATPCPPICITCNNRANSKSCRFRCRTHDFCESFSADWSCVQGCCGVTRNSTKINTTTQPSPICGGRELSDGYCREGATCGDGFLCTKDNVCCRCAFGTSMGQCADGKCPGNAYCSSTNNCCPFPNML